MKPDANAHQSVHSCFRSVTFVLPWGQIQNWRVVSRMSGLRLTLTMFANLLLVAATWMNKASKLFRAMIICSQNFQWSAYLHRASFFATLSIFNKTLYENCLVLCCCLLFQTCFEGIFCLLGFFTASFVQKRVWRGNTHHFGRNFWRCDWFDPLWIQWKCEDERKRGKSKDENLTSWNVPWSSLSGSAEKDFQTEKKPHVSLLPGMDCL